MVGVLAIRKDYKSEWLPELVAKQVPAHHTLQLISIKMNRYSQILFVTVMDWILSLLHSAYAKALTPSVSIFINRAFKVVCVLGCSVMFDSATPCTVARQAPLSMGFPRQEFWSGCQFLLQGIFLTQGSNLGLPHCEQILYCLSHQAQAIRPVGSSSLTRDQTWPP